MAVFGGDILKIIVRYDIKKISEETIFSYREIYVLLMFIEMEMITLVLDFIALYGMSVGMFLIQVLGIPQSKTYELLNGKAEYVMA